MSTFPSCCKCRDHDQAWGNLFDVLIYKEGRRVDELWLCLFPCPVNPPPVAFLYYWLFILPVVGTDLRPTTDKLHLFTATETINQSDDGLLKYLVHILLATGMMTWFRKKITAKRFFGNFCDRSMGYRVPLPPLHLIDTQRLKPTRDIFLEAPETLQRNNARYQPTGSIASAYQALSVP